MEQQLAIYSLAPAARQTSCNYKGIINAVEKKPCLRRKYADSFDRDLRRACHNTRVASSVTKR